MKITASLPVVLSPSRGITLPVSNSAFTHVMCKKSLTLSINKVINNCLTESPASFGRYFTGTSDITVNALLFEGGTQPVDVTVNLEMYSNVTRNHIKCLIFIDGKCYGNVGFRAVIK